MSEPGIGLDIQHWRHRSDSMVWIARIVTTVLALLLVAVAIRSLIPDPWWARAGFERDPGLFVRKHAVDYPVCAEWASAAPRGWHLVEKSLTEIPAAGSTVDIGFLLPPDATVANINCGDQLADAPPVECSMTAGCAAPVTVALDDDVYTRGRALTLMVTGKSAAVRKGESFHVWLAWK